MKAKLSLKGILNQWHLNCLCWDRSQKSRTPSNMLARISQLCDFLSGVNNAICREISIHRLTVKREVHATCYKFSLTFIFYQRFPQTRWINVPQFRRWNATSSFSISMLHLLYPSLQPRYLNVNLLNPSIFSLIRGYPPLRKKKQKNKTRHESKEFVLPLCLRKSLWIFAQIKDVALVLNMSVYWQHLHSKGEIFRNDRLSLKRGTFLFQFSSAEKKNIARLNDLKEISPRRLVN